MEIRIELEKQRPKEFKSSVALALGNYGASLAISNNFQEAIKYRLLSSQKWEELSKESDVFKASLAFGYLDIASYYSRLQQFDIAETYYKKGLQIYEEIMAKYPNVYNTIPNLNLFEYEDFLDKKKNDIVPTKECLMIIRSAAEVAKETYAEAYSSLGVMYKDIHDYNKSISALKRAKQIYIELSIVNNKYLVDKAMTYVNIAESYAFNKEIDSSFVYFTEARKIFLSETLNKYQINFYIDEKLSFYTQRIAQIYEAKGNIDMSLLEYQKALELNKKLALRDTVTYYPWLVSNLKSIANLYNSKNDLNNALKYYLELIDTLEIFEINNHLRQFKLATDNLNINEKELPEALWALSNLQKKLDKYIDAENSLTKLVSIFKNLSYTDFFKYSINYAFSLDQLAIVQMNNLHYEKAIINLNLSLDIKKNLSNSNPQIESEIALTYYNLAYLKFLNNLKEQAKENYDESIRIYRILVNKDFRTFSTNLALVLSNASWNEYKTHLSDAIKKGNEAIEIYKKIHSDTTNFCYDYALCLGRIARYQILNKNFNEAEIIARSAVQIEGVDDSSNVKNSCIKNYAHALLFTNQFESAKEIYIKLKDKASYINQINADFDEFEKAGITHPDVPKIRKLLNN